MREKDFENLNQYDLVKIVVPQTLEIKKRFIEGDIESEIRFELTLEDTQSTQSQYCLEIIKRGGRVFFTVNHSPFIIHTEESLKYKEQTLRTYAGL